MQILLKREHIENLDSQRKVEVDTAGVTDTMNARALIPVYIATTRN